MDDVPYIVGLARQALELRIGVGEEKAAERAVERPKKAA